MPKLSALAVFLALAVCAPTAHAEEQDSASTIAFKSISPVLNALINADDAQDLMERAEEDDATLLQSLALYLAATREDPTLAQAPYHAAALFARRGDDALAERYLRQADERGMWFAPALADNDDFDHLRGTPFFKQVLANTQARYAKVSVGKVGAISVLAPSKGVAMPACAPVLVWLHGYGINGHLDSSEQPLADAGVVLLGINGTEMRESFDSFSWTGPYEGTHKVVQAGLEQLAARQCIDRKQVYLMGFSQGSQHAGALLAQHPDDYAGALLVSPGGWRQPVPTQSSAHGKRVFVINGEQEGPANQKMSADFRALFSDGNELRSRTHEGGHFYPDDWKTSFPQAIRWLMGKGG